MFKSFKEAARVFIAPLVAGLLAAGVANGAFYQWSKTAASNASADPSVNWAEGMSPSSVNDSARAMMARLAEYRDDVSGALATTGTATAYAVTTNEGVSATPVDGQIIAVTPNITNGSGVTLTADGGTAYPIDTAPSSAVPAGAMIAGTPYVLKFDSAASAWVLRSYFGSPTNLPLGAVVPYAGSTAPNGNFALAYGQCISRTTYASLFAIVGTAYGSCDGSTTFGLPDLRGRVVVGLDNMGGTAAGRVTSAVSGLDGTVLGGTGGAQSMTIAQANLPAVGLNATIPKTAIQDTNGASAPTVIAGGPTAADARGTADTFYVTSNYATGYFPQTTVTTTNMGSGTALGHLPPTQVLSYLVRVQ